MADIQNLSGGRNLLPTTVMHIVLSHGVNGPGSFPISR